PSGENETPRICPHSKRCVRTMFLTTRPVSVGRAWISAMRSSAAPKRMPNRLLHTMSSTVHGPHSPIRRATDRTATPQVTALAPTMLMMRTCRGRNISRSDSAGATVRHQERSSTGAVEPVHHVVDLLRLDHHTHGDPTGLLQR